MPVPDRAGELAEAAKVVVGGTAGGDGEDLVLFVEHDAAGQAGKEGRDVGRSLASHALDAAMPSQPVTTHLESLQQSVQGPDGSPVVGGRVDAVGFEALGDDPEEENHMTESLLRVEVFWGQHRSFLCVRGYSTVNVDIWIRVPQVSANERVNTWRGFWISDSISNYTLVQLCFNSRFEYQDQLLQWLNYPIRVPQVIEHNDRLIISSAVCKITSQLLSANRSSSRIRECFCLFFHVFGTAPYAVKRGLATGLALDIFVVTGRIKEA